MTIGWIEEVPGVNCQGHTHGELMKNLAITLKEALEFNRQDEIASLTLAMTEGTFSG